MAEFKDNHKTESVKKLKELAEGIDICMFCTQLDKLPITARPMSANEVDDEGNLWFISNARSNKNFEIKQDDKVQLFFSKISDSKYLSVFGHASIYNDRQSIEAHWTPIGKAWFEEGKDDPDVSVIKVTPTDAYYWDTKDGKAIAFLKWAANALGAGVDDGGVEGKINV
ncbi:MAG: general stress protein [Flavobacterium sp.]|nr:MAG: general stress protein [Flavobacterium sp.]